MRDGTKRCRGAAVAVTAMLLILCLMLPVMAIGTASPTQSIQPAQPTQSAQSAQPEDATGAETPAMPAVRLLTTGALTASGTQGTSTYQMETENLPEGATLTLEWTGETPAGVTWQTDTEAETLTLTCDGTTPDGEYRFRLCCGEGEDRIVSNESTLAVGAYIAAVLADGAANRYFLSLGDANETAKTLPGSTIRLVAYKAPTENLTLDGDYTLDLGGFNFYSYTLTVQNGAKLIGKGKVYKTVLGEGGWLGGGEHTFLNTGDGKTIRDHLTDHTFVTAKRAQNGFDETADCRTNGNATSMSEVLVLPIPFLVEAPEDQTGTPDTQRIRVSYRRNPAYRYAEYTRTDFMMYPVFIAEDGTMTEPGTKTGCGLPQEGNTNLKSTLVSMFGSSLQPLGSYRMCLRLEMTPDSTYKPCMYHTEPFTFTVTLGAAGLKNPLQKLTPAKDLVYTGEAQTLIRTDVLMPEAVHGTLMYRVNGGEWTEEYPQATETGTYRVEMYVRGDENYTDYYPADFALEVTILPGAAQIEQDGEITYYQTWKAAREEAAKEERQGCILTVLVDIPDITEIEGGVFTLRMAEGKRFEMPLSLLKGAKVTVESGTYQGLTVVNGMLILNGGSVLGSITCYSGGVSGTLPVASVRADGKNTVFLSLEQALTDANLVRTGSVVLTLLADATADPANPVHVGWTFTLNLNGYSIDRILIGKPVSGTTPGCIPGYLKVTGSGSIGTVELLGGSLTLESGTVEKLICADRNGSGVQISAVLSGGTVQQLETNAKNCTVTVKGGSHGNFETVTDWTLRRGSVQITGGDFGQIRVSLKGGSMQLSGGTFAALAIAPETEGEDPSTALAALLADSCGYYTKDKTGAYTIYTDAGEQYRLENLTVKTHVHRFVDSKCTECGENCDHAGEKNEAGKCVACGAQVYRAVVTREDGTVQYYDTVYTALVFQPSGTNPTITLLCDDALPDDRTIVFHEDRYILDLAGFTLTANSSASIFRVTETAELIIRNGTMINLFARDRSDASRSNGVGIEQMGGSVTLERVTIVAGTSEYVQRSYSVIVSGGSLTMSECDLTGALAVVMVNGGKVSVRSAILRDGLVAIIGAEKDADAVRAILADGSLFFDADDHYREVGQEGDWVVEEETYCFYCMDYMRIAPHTHTYQNGVCTACTYVCPHQGGEANCHEKAVCEACGLAYGELAPDNHDGGTEIRDAAGATCTENGYTGDTYCKGCGDKLESGETITAPGHKGGMANCHEKAVCEVCNTAYGELNPDNHDGGTEIRDAAVTTCTEDGYTGDTYCKGCDVKLESGETIPAPGHKGGTANCHEKAVCEVCNTAYGELNPSNHDGGTEIRDAAGATCTENGYTGDTYCKGCNAKLESGEAIPAPGHKGGTANCHEKAVCEVCNTAYGELNPNNHDGGTEIRDAAAATCTENGYTGDTYCKGCNVKLESGEIISAPGHKGGTANCHEKAVCEVCDTAYGELDPDKHDDGEEIRDASAATCTENGYTGDTYCKSCGVKLKSGEAIPAPGHKGGTANCHEKAVCEVCNTAYGELNPENHDGGEEVRDASAATCTENGYTGDTYCKGCNVKLESGETILAPGHTGGEANCHEKAVCEVCNSAYGELNPDKHDGGEEIRDAAGATCTENGYTGDTYCKGCGVKLESGETIPAPGHKGGTANCHEKAVCEVCNTAYGELDPSNHDGGTEIRDAAGATCTENGYTGDTYCKGCNVKLKSGETILAPGHKGGMANCHEKAVCEVCNTAYGELNPDNHDGGEEVRDASAATCTENGYTGDTYCKGCGVKLESGETITAPGHKGGTANCHEKAVCEVCNTAYGELNPEKHDGGEEIRDAAGATCTENGYTGDTYCKGCNVKLESGEIISAPGHKGGTANCHEKAVCEVCNTAYGELDPSNHDGGTEIRDAAAATCTENGYTGDTYCKGCNVKLESGEIISAPGHKGGAANCREKAVCEVCNTAYGELNPKNHDGGEEIRDAAAATCTENGYTGDTYCKGCGVKLKSGEAIPAPGHQGGTANCHEKAVCEVCNTAYGEIDPNRHAAMEKLEAIDATETAVGRRAHWYCSACGKRFADAQGQQELTPEETVLPMLPPKTTTEETSAETTPGTTPETSPETDPETAPGTDAAKPAGGCTSSAGAGVLVLLALAMALPVLRRKRIH